MNKKDLIIGFLIGIVGAVVGCFIFLEFFTEYGFIKGFTVMKNAGILNKVITLGAILNLIIFFILLQKNNHEQHKANTKYRCFFSSIFI